MSSVTVKSKSIVEFEDQDSNEMYKAFINEDGELLIESQYGDSMVRVAKKDIEAFIGAIDTLWAESE